MQTVFEIFDCFTGKTQSYKTAKGRDQFFHRLEKYSDGFSGLDFLPASGEGFYVVDMRGAVKAGPFADRREALNKADYENMCSDHNSFSVIEHRL